MAANNTLHNVSAYLKKSFLICELKSHLICRMTHRMVATCASYVLSAKVTYCPPLPSRVITSFIGTMGEPDWIPTSYISSAELAHTSVQSLY